MPRSRSSATSTKIATASSATGSKRPRIGSTCSNSKPRSKRNSELLSTAGSILGGLLGGKSRSSILGKLGTAANRRGTTGAAAERLDAAENKVGRLQDDLAELEADLADDLGAIDATWRQKAAAVDTMQIGLEKTDIQVTQVVLAWLPVT